MGKQLICSSCGYIGSTKKAVRGSLGVEILLWLFFIIPGLIYSIWRQSTYHKACPVCGGTNLIPVDSPVGQKLLKEQGKTIEQVHVETAEVGWSLKKKVLVGVGVFFAISFVIGYMASL